MYISFMLKFTSMKPGESHPEMAILGGEAHFFIFSSPSLAVSLCQWKLSNSLHQTMYSSPAISFFLCELLLLAQTSVVCPKLHTVHYQITLAVQYVVRVLHFSASLL